MSVFNRLYNFLVNKLKFRRFALSSKSRLYNYGSFYYGNYSNWKHDPKPLIFCMYSGPKYTHGLNFHYLSRPDKAWFGRMLFLMVKGKQQIDGFTLYKLLKQQRISIIKTCYRVYFTSLCNYKLVGQGLNTHLYKMLYKHGDPWLLALNESLKVETIEGEPPPQIAYHPGELQERIIAAQNSVDITKRRTTPYSKKAPYLN